jgi:single-strand selective monofunctional uracil DNA glycosylase
MRRITDTLVHELHPLRFTEPITHVYNPLDYARQPYDVYLKRFGVRPKEILLVGMNPGPWGMAQTGIPFGEVEAVANWMGISGEVGQPRKPHPKRPIEGFGCSRREISGRRLWGWAQKRFGTPERFFARFFVANYCPLMFIEADGRNRTPDKLRRAEQQPLFAACDKALDHMVHHLAPKMVVGIGAFAEARAKAALAARPVMIGRVTHPSPANPKANRGWDTIMDQELSALGARLD